jgi:translation initiation factor IF-2
VPDKENKKPLGIKTGTLGIKIGEKVGIAPSAVKSSASTTANKGRVLVVTKSSRFALKSIDHPKEIENQNDDNLKRIKLLKQAALQKNYEQREQKLQSKQADSEAPKDTETLSSSVMLPDATERDIAPSVEEPVIVEKELEVRKINLDDLLRKGKVKNLDQIYRRERVKEPEIIDDSSKEIDDGNKRTSPALNPVIKPAKVLSKYGNQFESEDIANSSAKKEDDSKFSRRLTVAQVMMMDSEEPIGGRRRSLASIRRSQDKRRKKLFGEQQKIAEKIIRDVNVPDFMTVQELSNRMAEKTADVIKSLMKLGMMVTVNQSIDADTAEIIISEFGHKIKRVTEAEIESSLLQQIEDNPQDLIARPPVVTIMGHVDHGKTSLLDVLRNTDVAASEAGGITQHIGAYQITMPSGKMITFLDTPGHEAFTAMRMRGAKVTDIVVLVVAADDGIMQQTIEAINHAKAAGVPIIVAINKIDKPDADPKRVKNELYSHSIVPEDMGGDTIVIEVSAKQKINIDKLEESILLQAEFLDLKASVNRPAEGAVVEAKVDKGRGVVTTMLVAKGTLKIGDIVVAGSTWGKIRALVNDKGKSIQSAGPASPIEIFGLENAPTAGDDCVVVPNEKTARDLVNLRLEREKQKKLVASKSITLDSLFKKAHIDGLKELSIIVKADVQGSIEAIVSSLQKLSTDEIAVKAIHTAVGGITESDITLASASSAIIIGFNVRANQQAKEMARNYRIDIKYYSIIYNLVDDIKAAMSGMLSLIKKEEITGYAEVKQVFDLTKYGKIAGSYITEGIVKRASNVRLIRDSVVIYEGKLKALKRFKDDAKEVNSGFECGLSFENYEDIRAGDRIEAFDITQHVRTI